MLLAIGAPGTSDEDMRLGHHMVRPLVGVAPDVGGVALGDAIREGCVVAHARRDATTAQTMTRHALAGLKERLGASAPSACFIFSCTGRSEQFFGASGVETSLTTRSVGQVPMMGMSCAFEVGAMPVGGVGIHLFSCATLVAASGN